MRSLSIALLLMVSACGGGTPGHQDGGTSDAATTDAPPPIDAPPPDAPPIDATPPNPLGLACPTGTECPAGFTCLDEGEGWPGEGYCTRGCLSDAECGANAFCSPDLGGGNRLCLPDCSDCTAPGRVCTATLNGFLMLGGSACVPGNPTATDGIACNNFGDCNGAQACLNNPFDLPGGMCLTIGCTVGNDATCAPGGDGTCVMLGGGGATGCVDQCTMGSDCRVAEGYTCVPLMSGPSVCLYPHASPGVACTMSSMCGPAPWACLTGTAFPGGSCGAMGCDPNDPSSCPFDATCYDPTPGTLDGTEYCAKNCASNAECRTPQYTCQPSEPGHGMVCRH